MWTTVHFLCTVPDGCPLVKGVDFVLNTIRVCVAVTESGGEWVCR